MEETIVAPSASQVAPNMAETMAAPVQPVEAPTPPARPPAPAMSLEEERQRLEKEIENHRNTIAQLEQIITMSPAGAAPEYLVGALESARRSLNRSEQDLAAMPTVSGPDPAEVARLEEERARHSATITQIEQMLGIYPAGGAPDYLKIALDNARQSLQQVESDLAALTGTPAAAPPPTVPDPASFDAATLAAPPAPEAPGMPPSPESAETVVAPPAAPAPPPAAPPPAGPRLVLADSEQALPFPAGKTEIIIGREDPVSHIFPEIDLTPFGGESGGVSRQHARINNQQGQWTITDLNSTNFTHVDGKRLEPNTAAPLQDGSKIRFGRVSMVFKL